MRRNPDDAFERCLGLLHEAALDDARWPAATALVEEAVGTVGNAAWADGYLSAAVLSPLGAEPGALIAAASERVGTGGGGGTGERLPAALLARYRELEAGYREAAFVAEMFAGLGERELGAWARGLALGVGLLDAAWPTEGFTAEERRALSAVAALAEGERADRDMRVEAARFVRAGLRMRDVGGR